MSASVCCALSLFDMNALDRLECSELNGAIVLRSARRLARTSSLQCAIARVYVGTEASCLLCDGATQVLDVVG